MSKGFDFVAVAALVAALEEENEAYGQAMEIHKTSADFVEERRKRVAELQTRINVALDKLKETPVWGTPWHKEKMRENELRERQQALGIAQGMGMPAQHFQQYLQQANNQAATNQNAASQYGGVIQGGVPIIPPPPCGGLMK